MSAYVVLRQSRTRQAVVDEIKSALRRNHCWLDHDGEIPQWVALPHDHDQRENFSRASSFLTHNLVQRAALTAIVDEIDIRQINPMTSIGWSGLIAMLILAFPEVHWIFLAIRGKPSAGVVKETEETTEASDGVAKPEFEHELWNATTILFGPGTIGEARGSALFDGYGLRRLVRERMHFDAEGEVHKQRKYRCDVQSIPKRRSLAVVLDDETDFSSFEALMAYTRGFRVHAVATWNEAHRLLGKNGLLVPLSKKKELAVVSNDSVFARASKIRSSESNALLLTIEDFYLNFPDQTESGISQLDLRERVLPALSLTPAPRLRRRFVTSGHVQQFDSANRDSRRRHLDDLRRNETAHGPALRKADQLLHKPASGIYALWDELGLTRAFANGGDHPNSRGCAPGFLWPPAEPGVGTHDDDEGYGHSSPGRLLQIAQSLLERAATLANEADTLAESVRGAVLATQALEILGGRTPTLSLDALRLKHRFEISAECHFAGVEYHLSIEERLADIARNLESIAYWLHPTRKAYFVLNAQARIITELIPIFTNHGAFEEAEECRNKLRSLNNRIGFHATGRRKRLLHLLARPFNAYTDWVLRSSLHFIGTIVLVFVAFTVAFHFVDNQAPLEATYSTMRAMLAEVPDWDELGRAATESPASGESAIGKVGKLPSLVLNSLAAGFGLLNFGLLLSYLYNRIARK